MNTPRILSAAALVAACFAPTLASASVVEHVTMNFASGATFSGDVTFADDLSSYTGVDGTLSGGSYGTESINWIWSTNNFSSGTDNFSNWLMGSGHYIQLAYNYSNPAQLTFTSGISYSGTDNYINYSDAFVSGTIGNPSAVPEASNLAMLLAGLGAMGLAARRQRARNAA
jgi:hypothetical protein